jgi:hypothetical protein
MMQTNIEIDENLINEILKKNQDQDKARGGGGPCFKGISQNDKIKGTFRHGWQSILV